MKNKFKDLITNISTKRKFKDLVKVIKDKGCVMEEKVKYIERILDNTPELVNVKGPKHLLHYAVNADDCKYDRNKIVKLLLDKGADPNAKDRCGRVPLHYVMDEFGDYLTLDMDNYDIGKYNSEPELVESDYTVVNKLEGQCDILEKFDAESGYLIVSKKNVKSECSKLDLEVDDAFFQLVDLLLEKGASIDVKDCYGRSPLDIINVSRFSFSFYSNLSNKVSEASQKILERIRNQDLQNPDKKVQTVSLDNNDQPGYINEVVVSPCNKVGISGR